MAGLGYDIFVYCGWVSTHWRRSVDLYKNKRQLHVKGEAIHKAVQKHRMHKKEHRRKNIKKSKSSNYKITKRSKQ
jgi:hypothetical protein